MKKLFSTIFVCTTLIGALFLSTFPASAEITAKEAAQQKLPITVTPDFGVIPF